MPQCPGGSDINHHSTPTPTPRHKKEPRPGRAEVPSLCLPQPDPLLLFHCSSTIFHRLYPFSIQAGAHPTPCCLVHAHPCGCAKPVWSLRSIRIDKIIGIPSPFVISLSSVLKAQLFLPYLPSLLLTAAAFCNQILIT